MVPISCLEDLYLFKCFSFSSGQMEQMALEEIMLEAGETQLWLLLVLLPLILLFVDYSRVPPKITLGIRCGFLVAALLLGRVLLSLTASTSSSLLEAEVGFLYSGLLVLVLSMITLGGMLWHNRGQSLQST